MNATVSNHCNASSVQIISRHVDADLLPRAVQAADVAAAVGDAAEEVEHTVSFLKSSPAYCMTLLALPHAI